jgi:hypothetical protein
MKKYDKFHSRQIIRTIISFFCEKSAFNSGGAESRYKAQNKPFIFDSAPLKSMTNDF